MVMLNRHFPPLYRRTGDFGQAGSGLDERLYVQTDANFNVTSLLDTTGSVVERFLYDPYGTFTVHDPNWTLDAGGSDFGWVHLHQGGRYDADTGLYHFRFRDYDPELGRWINPDPAGYVDGPNTYEANGSAPTNLLDPFGLASHLNPSLGGGMGGGGAGGRYGGAFSGGSQTTYFPPSRQATQSSPLSQDAAVKGSKAPPLLHTSRPIAKNSTQNQDVQRDIGILRRLGAIDIRVNQRQVDASGNLCGINRPDLQFILRGVRYYVEYEGQGNGGVRISRVRANNPAGMCILIEY